MEEETRQVLSRKDREREWRRADVLKAAERVFVRDGRSAKIESIAKEAEYAVGSIYNFFPSKDDLFKEVLLSISEQRVAALDAVLGRIADDPWAGLDDVVRFWLDHHREHGDFLHIAMSQRQHCGQGLLPADDPAEKRLVRNADIYRAKLADYFASLRGLPGVRPLPAETMSVAFEGVVRTSLFRASRCGRREVDWDRLFKSVAGMLRQLFSE